MTTFPDPAPPLLPLLDAAGIWNADDLKKIEAARDRFLRKYPQFEFHVFSVMLPPGTSLPAFGFWLLNVCPFVGGETPEDRAWSVLLLVDARQERAAVVPGYSAERWISDDDWQKALAEMAAPWKAGKRGKAVVRFFEASRVLFDRAWKTRGQRRMYRY